MTSPRQRWIVLDVGETIIEETRIWSAWADAFGIPRTTFMSVLGSIVERGLDYQHILDYFPGADWTRHRTMVQSEIGAFRAADLYPDALAAVATLRKQGYRTAVIANQPAGRRAELQALGVEAEVMAMSDEMGVSKPDLAFFSMTLGLIGDPDPADVAYVGDRIDNDVLPAAASGMRAIWLRRGPWGVIPREAPPEASLVVASLAELVERIDEAWE